ncbi:hypothetical protein TRAPUB_11364 [Trametes pubescens]|uniref:DUF659 domain-containing protein n=1 Tax=Trametes pubescens TaxID=154538 RepID=A0A1M2VWW7_TRAPU|nr:hypothetical protein TRAPUB_11364 [Trametes pubescens]
MVSAHITLLADVWTSPHGPWIQTIMLQVEDDGAVTEEWFIKHPDPFKVLEEEMGDLSDLPDLV